MKKYRYLLLTVCLILSQANLYAQDWGVTDGAFTCQKDVDSYVFDFHKMASVYYNGKVFNFTMGDYVTSGLSFVHVRTMTVTQDYSNINFSSKMEPTSANLDNLGSLHHEWQPAAVVFKNQLILFVVEQSDRHVSYSIYNDTNTTWSTRKSLNLKSFSGMSASVVGNKLCLVSCNFSDQLKLWWTEDMQTWNSEDIDSPGYSYMHGHDGYRQLSTIGKSFSLNGVTNHKLLISYINNLKYPVVCDLYFGKSNQVIVKWNYITTDFHYQSVALAEGTVLGDPNSHGDCVQAFLKKDDQDNGYVRWRILRYQLKDSTWSKAQNNLLKQNYEWAYWFNNLTALNVPKSNGGQFMCLFYVSYDDWDCSLNCAYVSNNTPPVNVSSFTANKSTGGVTLKWETKTEENNYGFEIQRQFSGAGSSVDNYKTIGFEAGNGTGDSSKQYNFVDANPLPGKMSYRLKQIDVNKNFAFSDAVEINAEHLVPTDLSLSQNFPNPFNPTTSISFAVPSNGYALLRIFNTLGQEVARLFDGEAQTGVMHNVRFNASGLSSGVYYSRLECNGKVLLKKMQLIK